MKYHLGLHFAMEEDSNSIMKGNSKKLQLLNLY